MGNGLNVSPSEYISGSPNHQCDGIWKRPEHSLSPPCEDPASRQQPANQEEGHCLSWHLDLEPPNLQIHEE